MTIEINTAADERLYSNYLALRDAPRLTLANQVYPAALKALDEYDALIERLTKGDLQGFGEYHANITEGVAPYIQALYTALETIVNTMRIVDTAAPGTFGIELPQEQPVNE